MARIQRAIAVMHTRGMNRTEQQYERHLRERLMVGEIRWYEFEPLKLRLADNTFYSPDFLVVGNDLALEAHEVKSEWSTGKPGWQEDARVKVKIAAEHFPLRFVAATHMKDGSWNFEWFIREREEPKKSEFVKLVEIEDKLNAMKWDTEPDKQRAMQLLRFACGLDGANV